MLSNGDFEKPWANNHLCRVFRPDGSFSHEETRGSVFVPQGWHSVWFKHGLPGGGFPWDPDNDIGYAEPEARHSNHRDPDRMVQGEQGMLVFTFGRVHDAGFMTQVQTLVGRRLRLTAWAHAWSNHKDVTKPEDFPHPDDARWSEGAGHDPYFAIVGATQDSKLTNFTFSIGVDPLGGLDPFAPSVVWGAGAHIYNVFAKVPAVTVVAQATTVTVFTRSTCRWRFKHSDAYWDAIDLAVVEDTVPGPDPGPVPVITHGSKIGAHALLPAGLEGYARELALHGTEFGVIKAVDDLSILSTIKRIDPATLTIGRLTHDHEGASLVHDPSTDMEAYAAVVMQPILAKIASTPALRTDVNYWEPVNEPLGGGVSSEVYGRLARLMMYCMDIADRNGLYLALFAFNAGTPEYWDMQAIVATGVFEMAGVNGHILAVHEGVFGNQPVDLTWDVHFVDANGQPTQEDTKKTAPGGWIPGGPVVRGAGAYVGRYRFWQQLGVTIPVVTTEFYAGGGYAPGDATDILMRMAWADDKMRGDPRHLGIMPFTLGPVGQWKDHDYGPFYSTTNPAIVPYMVSVKDEPNPVEPGPGPGPDPVTHPGDPREQYRRTYVLLPDGAGALWAGAVVGTMWDEHAYTVGRSADDACVGRLEVRRVIAVNPDDWGAGDGRGLLGFIEKYYSPGVAAVQVVATEPGDLEDQLRGKSFEDLSPLLPYPAHGSPSVPTPQVYASLLTLHLQNRAPGDEYFLGTAKPAAVVIFHPQDAAWVKQVSPQTAVILRYYITDAVRDDLLTQAVNNPEDAAARYLSMFWDDLSAYGQHIDFVKSLNEPYGQGETARNRAAVAFDVAFAHALAATELGVAPVVLCAAVNNPSVSEVRDLVPAARAAVETGGLIGYNGYFWADREEDGLVSHWEQHTARQLTQWDAVFKMHGLNCYYFSGETGAVASLNKGQSFEFREGWRHANCMHGNWARYRGTLLEKHAREAAWNAANGYRYLGGAVFTQSGSDVGWPHFMLDEAHIIELADELAKELTPVRFP